MCRLLWISGERKEEGKEIFLKKLYHKLWFFASEYSGFHFQICQTWVTEEFLFTHATNLMTIIYGGVERKKKKSFKPLIKTQF